MITMTTKTFGKWLLLGSLALTIRSAQAEEKANLPTLNDHVQILISLLAETDPIKSQTLVQELRNVLTRSEVSAATRKEIEMYITRLQDPAFRQNQNNGLPYSVNEKENFTRLTQYPTSITKKDLEFMSRVLQHAPPLQQSLQAIGRENFFFEEKKFSPAQTDDRLTQFPNIPAGVGDFDFENMGKSFESVLKFWDLVKSVTGAADASLTVRNLRADYPEASADELANMILKDNKYWALKTGFWDAFLTQLTGSGWTALAAKHFASSVFLASRFIQIYELLSEIYGVHTDRVSSIYLSATMMGLTKGLANTYTGVNKTTAKLILSLKNRDRRAAAAEIKSAATATDMKAATTVATQEIKEGVRAQVLKSAKNGALRLSVKALRVAINGVVQSTTNYALLQTYGMIVKSIFSASLEESQTRTDVQFRNFLHTNAADGFFKVLLLATSTSNLRRQNNQAVPTQSATLDLASVQDIQTSSPELVISRSPSSNAQTAGVARQLHFIRELARQGGICSEADLDRKSPPTDKAQQHQFNCFNSGDNPKAIGSIARYNRLRAESLNTATFSPNTLNELKLVKSLQIRMRMATILRELLFIDDGDLTPDEEAFFNKFAQEYLDLKDDEFQNYFRVVEARIRMTDGFYPDANSYTGFKLKTNAHYNKTKPSFVDPALPDPDFKWLLRLPPIKKSPTPRPSPARKSSSSSDDSFNRNTL